MPEKIMAKIQGETFSNETSLPSLSVPSLQNSLEQLKTALSPMLNEEDFGYLQEKIDEFINDPISSKLQNHLHKFQQNEACYLDHLNMDHILVDHHALPRNPFLVLENDPLKDYILPQGQASRAAVLTTSALKFVASLRLGTLKPDKSKSDRPLTMKPYLNLFGTTRYPEFDSIRMKSFENSRHIIIISNSLFFKLDVINDSNELLLTSNELNKILDEVLEISNITDRLKNIGSVTSDSYKYWKHGKSILTEEYKENMIAIDSALFVLVLDHSSPNDKDEEEVAKTISVGTLDINEKGIQVGSCNSRWYDKLQLIVTKNAIAGVCWDSYGQDGTTVLRFTSDIYTDSVLRLAEGDNYTLFPGVKFVKPDEMKPILQKLQWDFRPEITTFLHLAETRLTDLICSHSTNTSTIKYGSAFAKKIGVKADSLIQVALQIAHYALYGKPLTTVEPVTTRFFRNSRSEHVAIQQESLLKTCQTFVSDASNETRWESFISSCQVHAESLRAASKGNGFETHIKALQNVYLQREVLDNISPEFSIGNETPPPPLLFDNILNSLFVPDLIASNCGNPALRLFGLTPAINNGFGIGYIIKNDETKICLISEYRQGDRLLSTLDWVIHQLRHIWKSDIRRSSVIPHAHILDNQKNEPHGNFADSVVMTRAARSYSVQSEEDEDVDLALGGYGYFDIDDLTIRSVQHSRSATPLQSHNNSTTNLITKLQQSQKNLIKEAGKKLKFECIKDTFDIATNKSSSSLNSGSTTKFNDSGMSEHKSDDVRHPNYNVKFDRAAVGKKVLIDNR